MRMDGAQHNDPWDFWIDRGGTFTDVIGRRPDGTPRRAQAAVGKSRGLSRRRGAGHPRPARRSSRASRFPPALIGAVKMGTTVATNALLERKGERTLLVTTSGFRDALRDRLPGAAEDLRHAHHQAGACSTSASSRSTSACAPTARSSSAPDLAALRARARGARRPTASRRSRSCSCTPIAIPSTSSAVAALAREIGFPQVSVSHEVSPLIKLVGRGDTTVVDAYLSPILRRYVGAGGRASSATHASATGRARASCS